LALIHTMSQDKQCPKTGRHRARWHCG